MSALQDRLVLVVGAPRSGTTWLQRAVAAHPDAVALPSETHLFSAAISVLRDHVQGGVVASPATGTWFMPEQEFRTAARAFCDSALGSWLSRVSPDALRVVERSPTHVWHLGLVAALYPDAYVLHIVRDGRDVVRSQVAQTWGPSEIASAAGLWASAVRSARAAAPALPRYLEVSYEGLLARPESIEDVWQHLGLAPVPLALRQSLLESGLHVNVDPTRPDVAAGKWRRDWDADDITAFRTAAGDVLEATGHTWRDDDLGVVKPPPSKARRPAKPQRRRGGPPLHEQLQGKVDRWVADLAEGGTAVADALTPAAVVQVHDGDVDWRLLGTDGAAALRSYLAGPWGAPLRGDQQVTGLTWTLVLQHDRARVLQLLLTEDHQITELRLTAL